MTGKRDGPEGFVSMLGQGVILQGQSMSAGEVVRQICVKHQTCYRWREVCGGMGWSPMSIRNSPKNRRYDRQNSRAEITCRSFAGLPAT